MAVRKSLKVSEDAYAGYISHARRLGVPISALVEAIGLTLVEMERGEVKRTGPASQRVSELAREVAWSRRMRTTD